MVTWEGRVEVRVNDAWGTVCSFSVDPTDAHIICQELGYSQALGRSCDQLCYMSLLSSLLRFAELVIW